MTHNPFEDLRGPKKDDVKGEEIEGSFSCQEMVCEEVVHKAKYLVEDSLLTWKCSEGHTSVVKGFSLA